MNNPVWDCSFTNSLGEKIQSLHKFPKYKIKNTNQNNNKSQFAKEKTSLKKKSSQNRSSHNLTNYTQIEKKTFQATKSQRIVPIKV